MKKIIPMILMLVWIGTPVFSCDSDLRIEGKLWTFHRMENGNSFHECMLSKTYSEGETLSLIVPCQDRYLDSIQIKWDDHKSKMVGQLTTMPGKQAFSKQDVSSKDPAKWTIEKKVRRFEIAFGGPKDSKCEVTRVRVFYGVGSKNPDNAIKKK